MNVDPHPWARELGTLHAHAWHRLTRGVHDRHAPARHPTLATVSVEGLPQARTVVLRKADRASGSLEIHTNLFSPKVKELRAQPVAALHVWDSTSRLQIRLQVEAMIAHGDQVTEIWSKVPEASRTAYSTNSVPGSWIPEALAYESTPDEAAFAVIRLDIRAMDLLHLGPAHRRAQFSREDGWVGRWLAP